MVRTIVFDVDDTLLQYTAGLRDFTNQYYGYNVQGLPEHYSLENWIPGTEYERRSIMQNFNTSWQFGCLEALRGAVDVVNTIKEYNKTSNDPIEMVILTKSGRDIVSQALRKANLTHVFGMSFSEIIIINGDESKKYYIKKLKKYRNLILSVDDFVQNALDMESVGVPSVVMRSSTNIDVTERYNIDVCENWYDIYETHIKKHLK